MSEIEKLKGLDASTWAVTRHYVHGQGGGFDEVGICRPYGIRPDLAELGLAFLRLAPELLALWEAVEIHCYEQDVGECDLSDALSRLNARAEEVMK